MPTRRRKNIGWTLRELMAKLAVMGITICIGLWCGWIDSYNSFYIAVLVQAVNNLYDSCSFLSGYTRFITIFQTISFLGALVSAILAILHFTSSGSVFDSKFFVIGIVTALTIPVLHFGIEVYSMIRNDRY